jgi:hypothetical protein
MLTYKGFSALASATSLKIYSHECVAGSVSKDCKAPEQQQEYSRNMARRVNSQTPSATKMGPSALAGVTAG